MTATTKALYTAEAVVVGDRKGGHGRSRDGALDVELRAPHQLGGEGGGTNPEQLFAVGFATCFAQAVDTVARRMRIEIAEPTIESRVTLLARPDRTFSVSVALDVALSGVQDQAAREIVTAAHAVCPYSNATRGNIDVALTANGQPVATSP